MITLASVVERSDELSWLVRFVGPFELQQLALACRTCLVSIVTHLAQRQAFGTLWQKAWPTPLEVDCGPSLDWNRAIVTPSWVLRSSSNVQQKVVIDMCAPPVFSAKSIGPEWTITVEWKGASAAADGMFGPFERIIGFQAKVDMSRERIGVSHRSRLPISHPLRNRWRLLNGPAQLISRARLVMLSKKHQWCVRSAPRASASVETRSDGSMFFKLVPSSLREEPVSVRLLPGQDLRAALWFASRVWRSAQLTNCGLL